ncbi:hypothetical protein, partial [Streptomyces sp. NPDC007206]|uniref:hypothetical protein n=1 Tax=Streptomyces sp. NPDC007206 TaxID=3154317 RepID=UPI0033CE2657
MSADSRAVVSSVTVGRAAGSGRRRASRAAASVCGSRRRAPTGGADVVCLVTVPGVTPGAYDT